MPEMNAEVWENEYINAVGYGTEGEWADNKLKLGFTRLFILRAVDAMGQMSPWYDDFEPLKAYICASCGYDFTDKCEDQTTFKEEPGTVLCMECFYRDEGGDDTPDEEDYDENDLTDPRNAAGVIFGAETGKIVGLKKCSEKILIDLPSIDELKEIQEEAIWRLRN